MKKACLWQKCRPGMLLRLTTGDRVPVDGEIPRAKHGWMKPM
ncbi:hypothetical protein ACLB1E_30305 [Escherichia coli]